MDYENAAFGMMGDYTNYATSLPFICKLEDPEPDFGIL